MELVTEIVIMQLKMDQTLILVMAVLGLALIHVLMVVRIVVLVDVSMDVLMDVLIHVIMYVHQTALVIVKLLVQMVAVEDAVHLVLDVLVMHIQYVDVGKESVQIVLVVILAENQCQLLLQFVWMRLIHMKFLVVYGQSAITVIRFVQ